MQWIVLGGPVLSHLVFPCQVLLSGSCTGAVRVKPLGQGTLSLRPRGFRPARSHERRQHKHGNERRNVKARRAYRGKILRSHTAGSQRKSPARSALVQRPTKRSSKRG